MNSKSARLHSYLDKIRLEDTDKVDTNEHFSNDTFKNMCPNFDPFPTVIKHQERVIAIGDIHGDMNLAINFLKAGKVITEIDNPQKLFNNSEIVEYIYRLEKNKLTKYKKVYQNYNQLFNFKDKHTYDNDNIVYRYYLVNNVLYVKVIQDDNNPKFDKSRWFIWTGGKTYVVQVGDQVDRCRPYPGYDCKKMDPLTDEDSDLEIMLLYDSLGKIAKVDGGRVYSLLGNHELMNVSGDTRYISTKGLREFSPDPKNIEEGEENRINMFNTLIAKKMACTRSTILVIGDYLFVHGGMAEKLSQKYKLIDINSIIRRYLFDSYKRNSNRIRDVIKSSKLSPLWYRRLAYIPMDTNGDQHEDCQIVYDPIIDQINKKNNGMSNDPVIQIKGMVIGHTPQFNIFNKGITTACNNRVIRADVGASGAFDHFATASDKKSREPQVAEILTNLDTKESTVNILLLSSGASP